MMRNFNIISVACFLIIIFLPAVDRELNLSLDKTENTEKRKLSIKPELRLDSLASFPQKYEAWFDDHFSFRNFLIKAHTYWSSWAYNISEVSDVLIGKDNWLYYVSKKQGNSIADYTGLICLDEKRLASITSNLESRRKRLESMGIDFLIVIAPDKHTIYPEYLPDNIRRRGPCPPRLSQVVDYLKKNSTIRVLDLRDVLTTEKKRSPFLLYLQTDSHWSAYGAFIGYQEIMKALGKQPLQQSDFEWVEKSSEGGDLAVELTLADRLTEKRRVFASTRMESQLTRHIDQYGPPFNDVYERVLNKNQNLPKLVLLQDSFGDAAARFIPFNFRESVLFPTNYITYEVVQREKPDILILEMVERYVEYLDLQDKN